MIAPTNRDPDQAKAAAFFTGALTLAAGGAGFLVAGLVLGFDYLLHGQPGERAQLAERRARDSRQRYEDALAWLEADRTDRARARRAKRDWFNADPETRGDAPATGETFGRVAARMWNSLIVGVGRFRRGWQDGRAEAEQRRAAGDPNWWRPRKPARQPTSTDTDPPTQDASEVVDMPVVTACGRCPRGVMRNGRCDRGCDNPAPAAGNNPQPTDDVIDAEIVPDPEPPTNRTVVPVGTDDPDTGKTPDLDGYTQRLDQLNNEVAATRNGKPADPSPPRTVLR